MSRHDLGADIEGCPHLTRQVAVTKATRTREAVMVVPGNCHQYAAIFALKKGSFYHIFSLRGLVYGKANLFLILLQKSPLTMKLLIRIF